MPTQTACLADHFIRSSGIAAVYVDACGAIGAVEVGIEAPRRCILLCGAAGRQDATIVKAAGPVPSREAVRPTR